MTTIADALKATLDAQWAIPTGGTEPTWYVSDDTSVPPPNGIDYVLIQSYTLTTRIDAVNNTYSNKTHRIDMEVNTPTGDDRLKELADEVERILNTNAITGVNWQKVSHRENVSDKRIPFFRERITCSLLEMLASSTSAYGADTTANALNSLLMYGSANAAWVPLILMGGNTHAVYTVTDGRVINLGATDFDVTWQLPLPTNKGGLKLYIKALKYALYDADADDYLNTVIIEGISGATGRVEIDTDATDHTSTGDKTFAGGTFPTAVIDCSVYDSIYVEMACFVTNAADLDLQNVRAQVYYDT